MNILVCMKQVPDTQKIRINQEKGTLVRTGVPSITNPFDESALELAMEIKQELGGTITALSMGIPSSRSVLRDALALGADRAYLLTHKDFAGADTLATSYTLASAISALGEFELLLFGKQAIDGDTAQVGPEVSAHLGVSIAPFVQEVLEVSPQRIILECMMEGGKKIVESDYPVALTVIKAGQRLRMPTLEGVLDSLQRPVIKLAPDDIEVNSQRCGLKGSPTRVKKTFTPKAGRKVKYMEGSAEEKAAGLLKVLKQKGIGV
ncbi:MAG: electron transfer flavoprotein subunit beta/FixA family protein [Spirochaetota bacterium]